MHLLSLLLSLPLSAWADSEVEVDPRVTAQWDGATVAISAVEDYEVYLTLRVIYGSEEYWIESGPHAVYDDLTSFVGATWPDLSLQEELMSVPAVVNGTVHVYTA